MFLLYHSKGCNLVESVLRECYVNDLYTTTCSGVLGHHSWYQGNATTLCWKLGKRIEPVAKECH
jgi:hypothetical protein